MYRLSLPPCPFIRVIVNSSASVGLALFALKMRKKTPRHSALCSLVVFRRSAKRPPQYRMC
ncbi:hypothetical protein D9M68_921250 [compost metagenome]